MKSEEFINSKRNQKILDFVKWSIDVLGLEKPYPKITFSSDSAKAQEGHHTGVNKPDDNDIWIYIGNRNLIDIFRTVFHELTHAKQHQLGKIKPGSSYPGSPIEAEADVLAGMYIKIYVKKHPEIIE